MLGSHSKWIPTQTTQTYEKNGVETMKNLTQKLTRLSALFLCLHFLAILLAAALLDPGSGGGGSILYASDFQVIHGDHDSGDLYSLKYNDNNQLKVSDAQAMYMPYAHVRILFGNTHYCDSLTFECYGGPLYFGDTYTVLIWYKDAAGNPYHTVYSLSSASPQYRALNPSLKLDYVDFLFDQSYLDSHLASLWIDQCWAHAL